MSRIQSAQEFFEKRDKAIAVDYLKHGGTLRGFAKKRGLELTLVWRAVNKWRSWAAKEIADKA